VRKTTPELILGAMSCFITLKEHFIMSDNDNSWHLDKKVPVALIVTLFLQLVGAVYGFATLAAQVSTNADNIIRTEANLNKRMDDNYREATRRYGVIQNALIRIEEKLDRKADK
jgi:hypothetical protein